MSCCVKKPRTMNVRGTESAPYGSAYGILKLHVSIFSSLIQTILSVPEFFLSLKSHRFSRLKRVADYTAGWDFHPTPKIYYFFHQLIYLFILLISRGFSYYFTLRLILLLPHTPEYPEQLHTFFHFCS